MIKIEALSDFVFFNIEKQKETKSGIILSDTSKSRHSTAKVVAVGPGRLDRHGNYIATKIKKGDVVIVDPFVLQPLKIDGEEILVARESDIFAIKK